MTVCSEVSWIKSIPDGGRSVNIFLGLTHCVLVVHTSEIIKTNEVQVPFWYRVKNIFFKAFQFFSLYRREIVNKIKIFEMRILIYRLDLARLAWFGSNIPIILNKYIIISETLSKNYFKDCTQFKAVLIGRLFGVMVDILRKVGLAWAKSI